MIISALAQGYVEIKMYDGLPRMYVYDYLALAPVENGLPFGSTF